MAIQALGPNDVPAEGDLTDDILLYRFAALINAWLMSRTIRSGESSDWTVPEGLLRQPELLKQLRERFVSAGWDCTPAHDRQAGISYLNFLRPV